MYVGAEAEWSQSVGPDCCSQATLQHGCPTDGAVKMLPASPSC